MQRFFYFSRITSVLLATLFLASCSFLGLGKNKEVRLDGLVLLASAGLSTTKERRDVDVQIIMEQKDLKTLKRYIDSLGEGEEASWTNKDTGNRFTVRAVESRPEGEGGSRKVVIWGRKKGTSRNIVRTYRYYF